jgi:thioredoxin-related protein
MRLLLLIAFLCSFAAHSAESGRTGSTEDDYPSWFAESFLEFSQELANANREGKRLLIYFGQEGCPYCRQLMQINFSQKDIVELTRKHFVPIALDIWGDRDLTWIDGAKLSEKQLAERLKVQFTPTILLLNERGAIIARLNGYYPPHRFRAALGYAAQKLEDKTTLLNYLKENAPAPARNCLTPEPFFASAPYPIPAGSSPLPLVVLFEHADCASCDALHDVGLANSAVRNELRKFAIVRLDLYGRERVPTIDGTITPEAEWAKRLKIVYAPTLIFFDSRRNEVLRMEADFTAGHLLGALRYVASGAYLKEPHFQRYIRDHYDELREAVKG